MSRTKIDIKDLGKVLKMELAKVKDVARKASHVAAEVGRNRLSQTAKVDMGQLKASLRVERYGSGELNAKIHADAPHAGIIERGARPHAVNAAGIASLTRWAMRKFGLPEDQAKGIAFAVATKLRREGQKPTWWFKKELPFTQHVLRAEVERMLATKPAGVTK